MRSFVRVLALAGTAAAVVSSGLVWAQDAKASFTADQLKTLYAALLCRDSAAGKAALKAGGLMGDDGMPIAEKMEAYGKAVYALPFDKSKKDDWKAFVTSIGSDAKLAQQYVEAHPFSESGSGDDAVLTSSTGPLVDPFSDVRVGQVYTVKTLNDLGALVTVKMTIKAKDGETLTINSTLVDADGSSSDRGDDKVSTRDATRDANSPIDKALPGVKVVKRETLVVSGVKFDCDVCELDDPTNPGKKMHEWICLKKFPQSLKILDGEGKTLFEVVEIK